MIASVLNKHVSWVDAGGYLLDNLIFSRNIMTNLVFEFLMLAAE